MSSLSLTKIEKFTPGSFQTITGTSNNGGLIRLTVSSTSAFTTGSKVYVFRVGGTTEANGFWTVTVVNSTTLELQNSTYTNAYVSGGIVQTAQTWSKESWASMIRVILIGGGGGGGAGGAAALNVAANGGSGGGGAAVRDMLFPASDFAVTENLSVAVSAPGGQTTSAGGTAGNDTILSINAIGNLIAYGGGPGNTTRGGGGGGFESAGTNTAVGGGGEQGGSAFSQTNGSLHNHYAGGGGGGGNPITTGAGLQGFSTVFGCAGGGAGGSKSAANVYFDGGAGGNSRDVVAGVAGTSTSVNGGNGTTVVGARPGSGGGGGASHATVAGNGGDGTVGCGGGGGGSTVTGQTAGKGGSGGPGVLYIIQYEQDPSGTTATTGYGMIIG